VSSSCYYDRALEFVILMGSPVSLSKGINFLLLKNGMSELDPVALKETIEELSDRANKDLEDAIRNEDIEKVLRVVGLYSNKNGRK